VVVVVTMRKFDVDVGSGVLVVSYRSAFLTDIDVFSAGWTSGLVSIFFTGNVYLFLAEFFAGAWREVGGEGRLLILSFPSDALLLVWEVDLTLDVSRLGGLFNGVVPVRRREDAEGDRDAGVKVQVDDLQVLENDFSNAFRLTERKTRRGLLLLG